MQRNAHMTLPTTPLMKDACCITEPRFRGAILVAFVILVVAVVFVAVATIVASFIGTIELACMDLLADFCSFHHREQQKLYK